VPAWHVTGQLLDANSLIYWPAVTVDKAMVSNKMNQKNVLNKFLRNGAFVMF
jgi:hypothetical protein